MQTHDYVHVIALDFSKAFDSVRLILLAKRAKSRFVHDTLTAGGGGGNVHGLSMARWKACESLPSQTISSAVGQILK